MTSTRKTELGKKIYIWLGLFMGPDAMESLAPGVLLFLGFSFAVRTRSTNRPRGRTSLRNKTHAMSESSRPDARGERASARERQRGRWSLRAKGRAGAVRRPTIWALISRFTTSVAAPRVSLGLERCIWAERTEGEAARDFGLGF